MPILQQPIDEPDAMAERILDLERKASQTKRSSLSGPLNPSPATLNPYSLELVGTGAGDPGHVFLMPHSLGGDGSPHTGTLYDAQGPQFAMLNGSRNYLGHLIPQNPDSYDLGQRLLPWRSLYTSEIRSTIFHQYEQFLISGIYSVVHGSGALKTEVAVGTTQIDFGQTMTANDIILIRADNNGSPQVEYMSIGSLVSGTKYNVTRNLDGSGANAWNIGTVYMVQGTTGDGWIDLDASNAPKLSLVKKFGPLFSDYSEIIRIGDLNGSWGFTASKYGAAFGRYADGEPHLLIEPGALKIRNRANGVNSDVITLTGYSASFEAPINLGPLAEIRQGSFNLGQFNGTRWTADYLGGEDNGVKQWWGEWNGKFYAGGGDIEFSAKGISLNELIYETGFPNTIKWKTLSNGIPVNDVLTLGIYKYGTTDIYHRTIFETRTLATDKGSLMVIGSTNPNPNGYADLTLAASINPGGVNPRTASIYLDAYYPKITLACLDTAITGLATLHGGLKLIYPNRFITTAGSGQPTWDTKIEGNNIGTVQGAGTLTYTANGGHTFVGPVTGTGLVSSNGWTPVSGTGWAAASAVQITNVLGANTTFTVGDKLKLTNNNTVKYFYVMSIPNTTTLNIYAGSDFLLDGQQFDNVYYSHEANPVGFPTTFNLANNQTLSMIGKTAILRGWGFVLGNGTTRLPSYALTFGITFASIPIRSITYLGWVNGTNPTTPTGGGGELGYFTMVSATAGGATIYGYIDTGLSNAYRVVFDWIAIGTI